MAKVRIEDEVVVDALAEDVWAAIEDPAAHASWHPFVTGITGKHSLGAIRRCAVAIGKKTGETSERCIEHEPERRIVWRIEEDSSGFLRMVSDWTAGFELEARDGRTVVRAESVFQPRNVLVRLMQPMVRRKFHGAQRAILAGLKASVER
jgi:uncharacterized protein YndB with AHSA1/START domain